MHWLGLRGSICMHGDATTRWSLSLSPWYFNLKTPPSELHGRLPGRTVILFYPYGVGKCFICSRWADNFFQCNTGRSHSQFRPSLPPLPTACFLGNSRGAIWCRWTVGVVPSWTQPSGISPLTVHFCSVGEKGSGALDDGRSHGGTAGLLGGAWRSVEPARSRHARFRGIVLHSGVCASWRWFRNEDEAAALRGMEGFCMCYRFS
jgi:hypothetical protein